MAIDGNQAVANPLAGTGLTPPEYDEIRRRLGRTPNRVELGMFGVMWSEHCAYKHSKSLLRRLPAGGPGLLRGPGENAGAVDVGNGWAAVFKMESHNHPSAVAPFHGAATGIGGIIRDVLAMGARPVALLDSLRFGPPDDPRVAALMSGVVAGIAAYGNSIGVPTVGGEIAHAPCYARNPLVNVACLGLVPADRLTTARAAGPGNAVVYLGARTGRDGMQGASFASAELAGDARDRSAVQMGDPFTGKLLIEATLEILATGAVDAIQDMGAAGLTCGLSEMSARGGVGMDVDVALVPRREEGMTPAEVLLSESQERMLLVVRAGREQEVLAIGRRWGLQAVVVGRVTPAPELRVRDGAKVVVSLDPRTLTDAPVYTPPAAEPAYLAGVRRVEPSAFPVAPPLPALLALLGSPGIADKRRVYRQYDHMIQTNTVIAPGGDAAVLRLKDAPPAGLALAVDGNGRYCYLHPRAGGMLAVLEAAQNLACAGAAPVAVTDCLNFANPERPEVYWTFREAVEGIAAACEAIQTPVVGGNVSFYNESGETIYPTPTVAMLGRVADVAHCGGTGWRRDGDVVALLGEAEAHLDGSEYLAVVHGVAGGRLPAPDLPRAVAVIRCTAAAVEQGLACSAHDCADGGIAVALAECCASAGRGARLGLPAVRGARSDAVLFGEAIGRVVVSVSPARLPELMRLAADFRVPAHVLGVTGGDRLVIRADGESPRAPWIEADIGTLAQAWRGGAPAAADVDPAAEGVG